MVQTTNKVSFAGFCFDTLAFIPRNIVLFVKKMYGLAAIVFAGSFSVLYFAGKMPLSVRGLLLLFYILLLSGVYASAAVWICRYLRGKNVGPSFGRAELRYMLRLLCFWFASAVLIFAGVALFGAALNKNYSFEMLILSVLCITAFIGGGIFTLINLLPALPATILLQQVSFKTIWRNGRGYRWRIFLGSFSLLLLISLLSTILFSFFIIPADNAGIMILALLSGIAIFFLDICCQTVYLAKVCLFLSSATK